MRLRPLAVAVALAASLGLATAAQANIYECVKDGRRWITNERMTGARCKVKMLLEGQAVGASSSSSSRPSGGYATATASPKRTKDFRPPSIGPSRVAGDGDTVRARMKLYEPYITEASEAYGIPEAFIRAVIRVESNFDYKAVSSAGAQGLMQLMPGTARQMGVNDSFDPRQNIMGGTKYLRRLANRFGGDMVKVLSGYHAGSGAVNKKGGIPYDATESYVRAVLDHYYRYKM